MVNRRAFIRSVAGLFVPAAFGIIPARAQVYLPHRREYFRSVPATYTAKAVVFNGSTYLARGAALTGAANSKVMTVSLWFKLTGGNNAETGFILEQGAGFTVERLATNKIAVISVTGNYQSSGTYTSGGGWHHVAWSENTAVPVGYLFIDGVNQNITYNPTQNVQITLNAANWYLGNKGADLTGSLSDLWMSFEFFDISVAANLQKFRSSGGAPVNLGATGTNPTGNTPIVYQTGDATTWVTNAGSGGGFTVAAGSLSTDSSGPP